MRQQRVAGIPKSFSIIGHRGYGPTDNSTDTGLYPENTLKAFAHALDQGADGIELDVFLSRDGKAVVIHDPRLHEHVVPEQSVRAAARDVGHYTYEELQGFDLRQGQKIPALEEVFALVALYNTPRIINLDVKDIASVTAILDAMKNSGDALVPHPVVVSSYNWDILRAFRRHDADLHLVPAIKSALLFGEAHIETRTYRPLTDTYQTGYEKPVIELHREIGVSALDCAIPDYTPALIDLARSQGLGLQLSTGNTRVSAAETDYATLGALKACTQTGVPFVICKVDEPDGVIKKMGVG